MNSGSEPTKKKRKWPWIVGGIFGFLVVVAALAPDEPVGSTQPVAEGDQVEPAAVSEQPAEPAAPTLTGPQSNAARSAEQYLSFTGFSRAGLIDQLSSDAGDGYEVADATAAVDSLNVNWNEQAVKSAKNYLSITGFSCKGLIEQLSSSAGDQYSVSEATYGAEQAGAC